MLFDSNYCPQAGESKVSNDHSCISVQLFGCRTNSRMQPQLFRNWVFLQALPYVYSRARTSLRDPYQKSLPIRIFSRVFCFSTWTQFPDRFFVNNSLSIDRFYAKLVGSCRNFTMSKATAQPPVPDMYEPPDLAHPSFQFDTTEWIEAPKGAVF